MVKSALEDESINQLSSREIARRLGEVSDKTVRKVRNQVQPKLEQVIYTTRSGKQALMPAKMASNTPTIVSQSADNSSYQHLIHRRISQMMIGDAIYRLDDEGFGLRLEYIQLDLETMALKYVLYNRDTLIGKSDIRARQNLTAIRYQVTDICIRYGFTPDNAHLVYGGAVTSPYAMNLLHRTPSFERMLIWCVDKNYKPLP